MEVSKQSFWTTVSEMASSNKMEFSCLVKVDRILYIQEKQIFLFSHFTAFFSHTDSNLEKIH